MPLDAGARLGSYEILSPLGAGGMGEVYRARDSKLDRTVAVKILPKAMSADTDALARFEREAKAVAALSHPNILAIFDFGAHDGLAYAVMELLEGDTLRAKVAGGPLPPRKAIEYALQACHGLAAAHEKGIVHRDLKPENVFVTKDGRIKILDFGLAKLTPPPTPLGDRETMEMTPAQGTQPGVVMGTVGYMSPEQVRAEDIDQRSDIFSFGSILYEMLSGHRAFKADTPVETMSAILKQEPPELTETNRNIDPVLERIVRRCLEKQREARFQSARDLAFQLETISGFSTTLSGARMAALSRRRKTPRWVVAVGLGLLAAAAAGYGFATWSKPVRTPSYQQLTFQRGTISAARFAPDGKTILYSAAWNGGPMDVLSTRSESPESRSLGLPSAGLLSISSTGEVAITEGCEFVSGACRGTLARVPLSGGAPREVLKNVNEADWTPDGKDLAVVRSDEGRQGRYRLEFPPDKVLHEAAGTGWISHVRFSPKGDQLAFIEHPSRGDDAGSLCVVDLAGKVRVLADDWGSIWGLAWHPSGAEIWFTAAEAGRIQPLRAVTLDGKQRLLLQAPARLILQDISPSGDVLLSRETARAGLMVMAPGETREKDLSWFDWSTSAQLAADGKSVLFSERGEGTRGAPTIYLRGTDGGPAVKLGDGRPLALSPDGAWALTATADRQKLVLLPTGAGTPRELAIGDGLRPTRAAWFPRSPRLLLLGTDADRTRRAYVMELEGNGPPRAVTPAGNSVDFAGNAVSPDEQWFAVAGGDGKVWLHPLASGEARVVSGPPAGAVPIQWSPDGKLLYVSQRESFPARVHRVEIATGKTTLWREMLPADATGVVRIPAIAVTADGTGYAYTFNHRLSELYRAEGLQ